MPTTLHTRFVQSAFLSIVSVILMLASGCVHVGYTRSVQNTVVQSDPSQEPEPLDHPRVNIGENENHPTMYRTRFGMNELELLILLCSHCFEEPQTKALLDDEESGLERFRFGAFYKWGASTAGTEYSQYYGPEGSAYSATYMGGGGYMNWIFRPIESWNWFRVSGAFKMELGEFAANLDDLDEYEDSKRREDAFMFTFNMPLELGLLVYPKFLFGAGIELFAGTDLINWRPAFAGFHSYADKMLDYRIRAGYAFMTNYLALSAHLTWEHRSYGLIRYDVDRYSQNGWYLAQHDALGITLGVALNYNEIF